MSTQRSTLMLLLMAALSTAALPACDDSDDDSNDTGDGTPADGAGDGAGDGDGSADGTPSDGSEDGSDGDADGSEGAGTIVEVATAAGNFTTLLAALETAGLADDLAGEGPFTVFAPTDEAFAALPAGTLDGLSADQLATILSYHVVAGEVTSGDLVAGPVTTASSYSAFVSLEGGAKVNDATVTTADIDASNGVIHVIDKVLLPPNLVQAATYAGAFTTLLGAVETAELVETLADPEADFTVFAPTDDAFAALPAGTLEGLSQEELTAVLTYHVVAGSVLSSELTDGDVATVNGASVTIAVGPPVTVNESEVVIADVVTTNGVIHVIDAVLLPPAD